MSNFFRRKLKGVFTNSEIEQIAAEAFRVLLGISKEKVILYPERRLSEGEMLSLIRLVKEIKSGVPVQYALGETEFYGLHFQVNPSVLIPRPETEELCEWIINDTKGSVVSILDIGTGSGCIAITLAKHLQRSTFNGWDVSEAALSLARQNAENNGVEVGFLCVDVLNDQPRDDQWDIIVSNPPYVLESDGKDMAKHVLEHEPHVALFVSDNDPLVFYRAIANLSKQQLSGKGKLYFEIHEKYGKEVCKLLEEDGFCEIELRKDLSGKDRMIRASR